MSRTLLTATCVVLVVACFSAVEGSQNSLTPYNWRKASSGKAVRFYSTSHGGNCQSRCADRCGIMHKRQQRSYWDCTKRCARLATTCEVCYGPRRCLECMTGYRLKHHRYCVYDLCVINNGGCSALEDCTYSNGSVVCTCKAGYHRIGTTCTDINECAINNGGCAVDTSAIAIATCTNTAGSYKCACNQGYTGNGKTCTDINECLANNGGCSNDATCINGGGSFLCKCNAGYSGNGFNCADVNECDDKTAKCDANAACHNTIGSFTCTCNPGYNGDGTKCTAFPRSCYDIKSVPNSDPPCGEYSIWVPRLVQNITVYCEMGLGTGGYTFLNPFYIPSLNYDDIQTMIGSRSRTEILMRLRKKDGSQPFAKITQLAKFSSKDLLISHSTHPGYEPTKNEDSTLYIGAPYLYIGFLPSVDAGDLTNNKQQGIVVNGVDVTFTLCASASGSNRNNYFALYPNFRDRQPTSYMFTSRYPMVTNFVNNLKAVNSRRVMPEEYFMFFEMHFGGCGVFTQTDGRTDDLNADYLSVSIGFL